MSSIISSFMPSIVLPQVNQAVCIGEIPDDVLTYIFSFLGKDCGNARLVSKQFHA